MMKFFTILATVFCGKMIGVGADYYIEFRAAPLVINIRGQRLLTNYLYDCKGGPEGTRVFTSGLSLCNRVTSWEDRINIYHNANFFGVYRPDMACHVLQLSDRTSFTRSHHWYLGILNHAIDHPNFGPPIQERITHFQEEIEELTNYPNLPPHLVLDLAVYFATTNLIAFARDHAVANHFANFADFLIRVIHQAGANVGQETDRDTARTLRDNADRIVKLCLQKLIDPCAVLRGNLQTYASDYCNTYCNFLSFVSYHFNTCAGRCSTLSGGYCMGVVCTCDRELSHPFEGCSTDSLMSPMQLCHNSLRTELNL